LPTASRACRHVDVEGLSHQIGPRPVANDRRESSVASRHAVATATVARGARERSDSVRRRSAG
jgi:hypothetical protein